MKIGLALGGGGARGGAHLGVIKALEELGVKFDFIVGTSAGGFVAALYAHYGSVDNVVDKVKGLLESKKYKSLKIEDFSVEKEASRIKKAAHSVRETFMVAKGFVNRSLISDELIAGAVSDLLPDIDIESLPIKTGYVATDLVTGRDIVIVGGSLRTAVQATGSIPGIFPPVPLDDMVLVDGGATQKVPVLPAMAMGADVVIAVDISKGIRPHNNFRTAFEILLRIDSITSERLNGLELLLADVVIKAGVSDMEWYEFDRLDEAYDRGYSAARQKAEQLKDVQKATHFLVKKFREKVSGMEIDFSEFMRFYPERPAM